MATTRTRKINRSTRKQSDDILSRTGRTVKQRPYTSAAIASGAIAVGAAIAGAIFLSKRDKSFSDAAGDVGTRVKDGLAEATAKVKSLTGMEDSPSQSEIAEEALTLKETVKSTRRPVDPLIEDQAKTGAIAY